MRLRSVSLASIFLSFGVAAIVAPVAGLAETNDPATREALAKGDFAALRDALADRIRLEAPPTAAAKLEQPSVALELAEWRFLHDVLAGDPGSLTTISHAESGPEFLQWLLGNREALEEYLNITSVLTINEKRTYGLQGWREIWVADPASREPGLWRRVAEACAASFAVPRAHVTPKERYDFYRESEKAGQLVPYFQKAPPFELALTVHADGRGNDELEWAQDATPPDKKSQDAVGNYGHSLVAYRLDNYRGESVQGPEYFDRKYNDLGNIMEYGSVCGGISHMNMTVTNAHGVPAFTVGQPGHCAYVWRSDEKTWAGGNFVSGWKETYDSHQQPFWLSHHSADINLVSAAVEAPHFLACERLRWLASVWREKDPRAASAALTAATAADPWHWLAWKERIEAASANDEPDPAWKAMAAEIVAAFPKYPVAMTDLLSTIESKKALTSLSDHDRAAYAAAVAKSLASVPAREQWDLLEDCWDGWFDRQLTAVGLPEKSLKDLRAGKGLAAWTALSPTKRTAVEQLYLAVLPSVETNSTAFKDVSASWLSLVANDSTAMARAAAYFQGSLAKANDVQKLEMLADAALLATRTSASARADLVGAIRKRLEALNKPDPAHIDRLLGLLSKYDFRDNAVIGRWEAGKLSGSGEQTLEWDITPLLAKASGDYLLSLNFRWNAGAALTVKSARLFEDDKELSATEASPKGEPWMADSILRPVVVSLRLPKPKAGAHYLVRAEATGGADSAGVVLGRAEPVAVFNKEDWASVGGWGGKEIKAAAEITDGWHEMEFDVTKQIQQSGPVFVLFKYSSYASPQVMNVRMFVDGQEVSSDLHSCNPISGSNTMYSLRTPTARTGAKVTVRALFTHADGWGTVYLRKQTAQAPPGNPKTA